MRIFKIIAHISIISIIISCGGTKHRDHATAIEKKAVDGIMTIANIVNIPVIDITAKDSIEVTADNIEEVSKKIILNGFVLDRDSTQNSIRPTFESSRTNNVELNELILKLRNEGLIQIGDKVLKIKWNIVDMLPFQTLAITTSNGDLKYEPITWFSPILDDISENVESGSWRATHTLKYLRVKADGSKEECAIAKWKIYIQTEACSITNDSPFVEEFECTAKSFGYDIKCNSGELEYCRLHEECPECGELETGEECVKYILQTMLGYGGATIIKGENPTTGPNMAAVSGIRMRNKIKQSNRGGSTKRDILIGKLCAISGKVEDSPGEIAFEVERHYVYNTLQVGAQINIVFNPEDCDCNKVVFAQTIQYENDKPMIDADGNAQGTYSPFYNYDPKTGERVSNDGLGKPGDCSGKNKATLRDSPAQSNQKVTWEVCAICCDDGSILGCRKWSFDPTAGPPIVVDEDTKRYGKYKDEGFMDDFSDDAKDAFKSGLEEYLRKNPSAANDPCLKNFSDKLSE